MKQIYSLAILFVFLSGCSKDFLESFEDRIIGTWRIADVNRSGIGGRDHHLPFTSGNITFHENGTLTYVNASNVTYKGSWELDKRIRDDESFRILQITAVDFANQEVLSEYYDDMNFAGTDHFKTTLSSGFYAYTTHFRR